MTRFVALLHSIVVGPGRRVGMADLRAVAERLGYGHVRTLVSTGNFIFDAETRDVRQVETALEAAFEQRFGKHADIIARTGEGWKRLAAGNPFPQGEGSNVTVRVMRAPLAPAALEALRPFAAPELRLALVNGDLWIDFSGKPSETRLASHLTTKKLGIGTLRNANTVNGLCAMLG